MCRSTRAEECYCSTTQLWSRCTPQLVVWFPSTLLEQNNWLHSVQNISWKPKNRVPLCVLFVPSPKQQKTGKSAPHETKADLLPQLFSSCSALPIAFCQIGRFSRTLSVLFSPAVPMRQARSVLGESRLVGCFFSGETGLNFWKSIDYTDSSERRNRSQSQRE